MGPLGKPSGPSVFDPVRLLGPPTEFQQDIAAAHIPKAGRAAGSDERLRRFKFQGFEACEGHCQLLAF